MTQLNVAKQQNPLLDDVVGSWQLFATMLLRLRSQTNAVPIPDR